MLLMQLFLQLLFAMFVDSRPAKSILFLLWIITYPWKVEADTVLLRVFNVCPWGA